MPDPNGYTWQECDKYKVSLRVGKGKMRFKNCCAT